jgi:methionine-rich copper-binding protein CopC
VSRPGLVALALLLTGAAGAGAHAFLDRADPRAGSTVKVAPAQVRIWFTESLEPAFSSVRVLDQAGRRVDKGDSQVDPTNLRLLRVSLPPLPPGTYKVIWRVLSVDSHVTEGDFTFRVAP